MAIPHDTGISKFCGLLPQLGWASTVWYQFVSPELDLAIPALPHSVKPQLFSMIPSYLQNHYHLGHSYTIRLGCFHVQTLRKYFPEDFALITLVSSQSQQFFIPSWPASITVAKQRFYFSGSGIFLITANSSVPAYQNHRFLTHMAKESLFLPLKLHSPGTHCLHCSRHSYFPSSCRTPLRSS